MKVISRELNGLVLFEPRVFSDNRGAFFETYKNSVFNEEIGREINFVQDNHSISHQGVIRGLHFQRPPFAQAKLVRVVRGKAIDVVVDIRKESATYGEHAAFELSEDNKRLLWVPEGFAHGFEALEANTIFLYKCTSEYNADSEGGLMYNDKALGIKWQTTEPGLSQKDLEYPAFDEFKSPF
jgi:dTDP-4-dehydrorhamnose 3,5-epimerase